jgi:hypothetical protein
MRKETKRYLGGRGRGGYILSEIPIINQITWRFGNIERSAACRLEIRMCSIYSHREGKDCQNLIND